LTAPTSPYPFLDGRYVIDRSSLPEALKKALAEARHLDAMAHGVRRVAERWERAGRSPAQVDGRRKLADAYEVSRNLHLAMLWTFHGKKPPSGLALDRLRILESPSPPLSGRQGSPDASTES
jgi:hypothetical protein